ncbi:MAG: M14 family metallopeptidase, partial [Chloroflexota bacterium]
MIALASASRLLAVALVAIAFVALPASSRAANAFPANHEGYHNYAEMSAFLDDVVAAYPGIADKFSLGQSYQGRQIWALKISDNVGTDEDEPEALFMSMAHAREWLSQEENLRIIELLTGNYEASPDTQLEQRVKDIVDGLEIFIVPMVNPDGAEYDISNPDNGFKSWRKNRQPVPNGAQPGIDLNRNFGFKWACCGGSTGKPGSLYYRGQAPWQAVEVARIRDFVLSRIVDGRQQIRAAIDWHSFNEEIMWPFGYTKADQPLPMAADDLETFQAVGTEMAERNGYMAKQLSDLYIIDGGSIDWLYGDQRIFAFVIEVYPLDNTPGGFHPPEDIIERETTRNDQAVLYFLEHVACPYAAAGLDDTHCGPLDDDFETGRGWQVDPDGKDTAPASDAWMRAKAEKSKTNAGVKQRPYGNSARYSMVTGGSRGGSANANDIDGLTSVRSPQFTLGGGSGWTVQFRYTFAHGANSGPADYVRLTVGGDELWRVPGA